MTSADCWVQFWESDDYKKGTFKFDGPIDVPKMGNYTLVNPDGRDKDLDDQVDALKTGPSGWLELYKKKNYEGSCIHVYPGSSYPELDKVGMGDNTNSFRLFDQRPASWPVDDPDATGECWVRFYARRFNSSPPKRVNGPGVASRFDIWGNADAPGALTTGSSTWVRFYPEKEFGGAPISIGPNSLIQDYMRGFHIDTMRSWEMFDHQPKDWLPSSPPGENAQTFLSLELQAASDSLESLIAGVAGSTPVVGFAIKGLIGALWPNPAEPMEVWDSIKIYIDTLLSSLIDQAKAAYLSNTLDGLYRALLAYEATSYGTSQKGSLFSALLTELRTDQPYFVNPDDPSSTLVYMVPMSTIMLVMLREQALFYEEIYLEPDPNAENHRKAVNEQIEYFARLARQGVDDALEWRLEQVQIIHEGRDYFVVDAPANYRSGECPSNEFAQRIRDSRRAYVENEYRNQMDAFMGPVRLWKYLSPDNKAVPVQEMVEVQSLMLSDNNPNDTPFADHPNASVTGIALRSGNLVDAIQLIYGGEPGPVHGRPTTDWTHKWQLEEGEGVVAVFGGAGGAIDQLIFRTDRGREVGGGNSGGDFFVTIAPQGVKARLVRIDGYQSSTALEAVRFIWAYQRYV